MLKYDSMVNTCKYNILQNATPLSQISTANLLTTTHLKMIKTVVCKNLVYSLVLDIRIYECKSYYP